MKRSAERQLTKDSEDDDIEEVDPSQGFKKADEDILATRVIKGLPKRTVAAPQPPSLFGNSEENDSPPMFGTGFKGFGTASSSSFTFTAPTSASAPSPSISSTAKPSSTDQPFKYSTTTPSVSSFASPATKQFASFLGSSSQPNGTLPTASAPKLSTSGGDNTAREYFSSLRGLNLAFKNAVAKAIDQDPCVDLLEVVDQYKTFRATIQKDPDNSKKSQSDVTMNGTSNSSSPSMFGSKLSASAPTFAPSLPAPPAAFAGFGTISPTPASSTSTPTFGGFKPDLGAISTTSPFSFGTPSATSDKTPPTFTLPGSSTAGSKPSLFGSSDSPFKSPAFGVVAMSNAFGSSGASSSGKPPTSVFGSEGVSGGAPSTANLEMTASTSTTPSNLFGSSGLTSSTSTPANAGSGFGGFGFGAKTSPKGTLGNPVGFSFGGNTPTPESESFAVTATEEGQNPSTKPTAGITTSAPAPTGLSLTPLASSSTVVGVSVSGSQNTSAPATKASTPFSMSSAANSRGTTPASGDGGETLADGEGSSTTKVLGENPNDLEGEGEEEEETLHTSRVKIYKFKDDRWVDVGVGMLRIKKNKVIGSKRLLSRNSTNGKIMMNFNLYSGFKTTRAKQRVNFMGHDEGVNVMYSVRVKDEAGAIALKEAIDKEVTPAPLR